MSFTVEKKIADAHTGRRSGSTALESDALSLKLVYNKYSAKTSPENKTRINLAFTHGTGMNKEVWNYHIRKLYARCSENPGKNWYLGSVIALDAVFHGDSALLNEGKLGWVTGWDDGARDLVEVLRHENKTAGDFLNNKTSRNILVGHSYGGANIILAAFFEEHLVDTIVPIEAVCYYDANLLPFYGQVFAKVAKYIVDTFDSYEDFHKYYTKMSFYKTFHPEVLKDFVDGECYTVVDPDTKKIKYKAKASKPSQVSTYHSSVLSLEQIHNVVPLLRTQVVQVIGGNATWNPPDAASSFRENVKKGHLLDHYNVEGASHLVNGEQPDKIVDIIYDVAAKRAKTAAETAKFHPESVFNGNKQKILHDRFSFVSRGEITKSLDFTGEDSKL